MNKKIIIADASPLIAFGRINQINLINKTLGKIIIPETIAKECLVNSNKPGTHAIELALDSKIIEIYSDPDQKEYKYLLDFLDKGEATAITLASKMNAGLLIDEKIGREIAKNKNIKIISTAGVLLKAKENKLIKKTMPFILELKKSGYFLSDELIRIVQIRAKK